jgi:hypothetical protein
VIHYDNVAHEASLPSKRTAERQIDTPRPERHPFSNSSHFRRIVALAGVVVEVFAVKLADLLSKSTFARYTSCENGSRIAAMKSAWLLLTVACVTATSPSALSQAVNPSARDLLNTDRPLQPAEIAVVLAATRAAVSGKTCRRSYVPNGPGPEVLMGANGRPRFVRAISGDDYSSGAVSADGTGNRTQSRQSGHVDVVTFTE